MGKKGREEENKGREWEEERREEERREEGKREGNGRDMGGKGERREREGIREVKEKRIERGKGRMKKWMGKEIN